MHGEARRKSFEFENTIVCCECVVEEVIITNRGSVSFLHFPSNVKAKKKKKDKVSFVEKFWHLIAL